MEMSRYRNLPARTQSTDRVLVGAARPTITRRLALRLVAGAAGVALGGAGFEARGMPRMPPPIRFQAAVRMGPNSGLELAGQLWLYLGEGDEIASGSLLDQHEADLADVVGQVSGHALTLGLRTRDGARLYLVGSLERDIYAGAGSMGGVLSGPLPGDLGDWQGGYDTLQSSLLSD